MLPSSTLASDEPDAEAPASDSSGSAAFPFTGDAVAGGHSPVGPASLPLSHSAAAAAAIAGFAAADADADADADASPPPMPPRDPSGEHARIMCGEGRAVGVD
jgi:hypothetical protein